MKGDRLLRMRAVADRYGVSVRTIERWLVVRDGSIPPPAFDRPWRWRESDVDAHIAGATVTELRRRRQRRALSMALSREAQTALHH